MFNAPTLHGRERDRSLENHLRERYEDVLHGRNNIYTLFVKLGLELLKPGGWLGYVVSTNGAYFSRLREYIVENAEIESMIPLENRQLFEGAQQSVMLMVLRKTDSTDQHVFRHNEQMIFSERANQLETVMADKTTLAERNWRVKMERAAWNPGSRPKSPD